ncbi:MAG TPA: hypothetical protein VNU46_07565 [Gemmatimonadaceae bacterium]|nr:hypothetical protein [Gemmatimonadaceae bacterium]
MSDAPWDRGGPISARDVASPRRRGIARLLAISGLLLTSLAWIGNSIWLWTLTVGAPTNWRLRVLLPDAMVAVPCALGFAFAAYSPVPRTRRAGWGLVVVTLLTECLVTWSWIPSHG